MRSQSQRSLESPPASWSLALVSSTQSRHDSHMELPPWCHSILRPGSLTPPDTCGHFPEFPKGNPLNIQEYDHSPITIHLFLSPNSSSESPVQTEPKVFPGPVWDLAAHLAQCVYTGVYIWHPSQSSLEPGS